MTRKIYVDGNPFTVSEAAYDALHARSSLWRTRLIWTDYICIDQSILLEKAGQISLLKDTRRREDDETRGREDERTREREDERKKR